jgi:hypothetical protein
MARMTAGGIKPRQTSARMIINSQRPSVPPSRDSPLEDASRVRKERSGSLTPGSSAVFGLVGPVDPSKGKRVKV